jgi:hypothetical protein
MKRLLISGIIIGALSVLPATGARATGNPSPTGTGQPSQSCADQTSTPGNAVNAPGSPFNPTGVSGGVYANPPPSQGGTSSGNPHVVSQYDVACYHVSQ